MRRRGDMFPSPLWGGDRGGGREAQSQASSHARHLATPLPTLPHKGGGKSLRRRDFIALVGGAAAAWPLVARAQQAGKPPVIGFLGGDPVVWNPWTLAFVERLRELGWIEGRAVIIEYRWSEGRHDREAEIAAEFVRLKVDLIVTNGTAAPAVMKTTSTIPIVFAIANDPIGDGLVSSLSRPGGNITGSSLQATDIAGKRLEFLRTAVAHLERLAIIFDADFHEAELELGEVLKLAPTLGFEAVPLPIRRTEDVAPAFETLKKPVDGLYVIQNALIGANRTRILTFALVAKLPTMFGSREFVQAGGLMSYGPSFPTLFRRAADTADKILKGTKAGDIPVEQPTKFDLVVNLTTARALGVTMPESLLSLADEVIE
jgi:putative tryptophan/tyrosine transport system substrate-binding protein